jgi:tetratricopeptide (TPR) repeat protein
LILLNLGVFMTRTEPILCTIHYVVDGQEYQYNDDQYLPDIPIAGVIKRLVELIKLQPYLDEPQQGVPTLHTALEAPPLDPAITLSAAGLVDGAQIWLVITPTYLPTTIHWSAGKSGGQLDLVLPTRLIVSEHISNLLEKLALRERVDGPMKSVPSLHSAADAPALALDQNLLDLKLRANGQLWFKVEPAFLPVTLHWQDAHGEQAKRLFLDVEKMLGEHLAERVRLIPAAREAISGPEKCVASLRTTPQGVDLPADQKLRDAQITEDTDLWIVWVPTVAEITLHYPEDQGDVFKALRMALPLNRSISDIIRDVAHEIGLASSRIQLASSQDARPWSAQSTLADHRIRSGDDIWVRAVNPPRPPAPIIIAGVVAVLTVAALILGVGRLLGSTQSPQPTALAEAPTVTLVQSSIPTVPPATAIPTSIPTPTRTIEEQKRFDYALGREAYQNQDWPGATDALKRVYALDPAYLDTVETLAATQYNWAVNTLTSADRATESLTILRETFVYSPTHQPARDLEQRLVLYTDGVSAAEAQNWETTIRSFEQLRGISPDFLDVAQQLYDAYMAISNQRREANNSTDALASCRLAAELPVNDTSAADECVVALSPPPVQPAVPAQPPAPARPSRLAVSLRDRDPNRPTCISVRVRFIDSSGWYFKVNGLNIEPAYFRGGDAQTCSLQPEQQVTFNIYNSRGNIVQGGEGIRAKGSDIFYADWVR